MYERILYINLGLIFKSEQIKPKNSLTSYFNKQLDQTYSNLLPVHFGIHYVQAVCKIKGKWNVRPRNFSSFILRSGFKKSAYLKGNIAKFGAYITG